MAGDLSDDVKVVEVRQPDCFGSRSDRLSASLMLGSPSRPPQATLVELKRRYAHVFFTPGNHELWSETKAAKESLKPGGSSLDKLDAVLSLCSRIGVYTQPTSVGGGAGCTPVLVIPMLSWHHAAFDTECDIPTLDVPPASQVMKDFHACRWPPGVPVEDVARLLDARNEAEWRKGGPSAAAAAATARAAGHAVVSFSHFLPRLELCPEKRFLFFPNLIRAVGSTFLGARVSALKPDVHVFGHTHFSWDATLSDGVRYLSAQLGYPQERDQRMGSLRLTGPDTDINLSPVLVYDSAGEGQFAAKYLCHWSEHYVHNLRNPHSTDIPWWVQGRWKVKGAARPLVAP